MNNKRKALVAVLSAFALSTAGAALMTGCGNKTVGHIDAPTSLEADLGTYVIPDYDVVDENGMILAGYNVYLKSVKDANGEEISVNSYGSVTVDTAGVYSFVYTAGSKNVEDVTVSIDFADRTAPTINYDDRNLPDFFIRGNEYKMPAYTLSGDYVREKCWAKVYYVAEDKTETEVKIESGRFKVDKENGSYAIRVHVEDAVGNANDYEYVRKVDGPKTLVENRVLYFNEEFGARQVSCYEDSYKGEFVTEETDGAKVYEGEDGAYKVTFDGVSKTSHNEGYISMGVPALINLYEYERLEMWVYNDSGKDIVMGSNWWNDTKVENGKWTKLVWNTREWGGANGNKDVTNSKYVGVTDISGMVIRFIFDYGEKVIPNGTFYFSSMNAVPKVPAEITETECATEGGGVVLDQSKYFINDTVNLSAKKVEGKIIDCYKVDGVVIPGSSFTVTKENHTVEAVYAKDPLTPDTMTWATPTDYTLVGDDAMAAKLGEGKKWVLTYDVYGIQQNGWNYFGAYVGGTNQLLGFELDGRDGQKAYKFFAYGGSWKWIGGTPLSSDVLNVLWNATESKPATIKYIRDGNLVKTFVEYDGTSYFVATVDIVETLECRSGNGFGIGGRGAGGISNVPVHKIRAVEGETKTELVHATYPATVRGDDVCVFEDKAYRIGDIVTLSAPAEKDEKLFLCYKVNDVNIAGNSFAISESEVTVEAYYTDPCTVTLADGLSVDGQTGEIVVPAGKVITVMYNGTSPDGKYFDGVLVGDKPYTGGAITITESISVTVKYENRIENDNEKLNDIAKAAEEGGIVYTNNSGYNPTSIEYVTDFGYEGENGTVDAKNSLKVTLSGGEQGFSLNNGEDDLGKYSDFYFYAYTEVSGLKMGSWWCNDTPLTAGKWTKVNFNWNPADKNYPKNVSEQNVWEHGLNQFIYRVMNGKSGDVVYVTAVYGVPFADVTVTKTEEASGYLTISEPKYGEKHKINETVILECTGAPANKAFVCFTADGKDIVGSTYTLTADMQFGIRFEDTSTITVDDGIEIEGVTAGADGKYIVGKGAKLKLSYTGTPESGKIFDYFLVDNTLKIYDDAFTTSAETHTIEAVFADSKADITWGAGDTTRYTKEKVMGDTATSGWFDEKFDGQIFGSSQHWAVKVNVQTTYNTDEKNKNAWNAITFVTGSKQALLMRWHGDDDYFAFCALNENGDEHIPANTPLWPAYVDDVSARPEAEKALRKKMAAKLNAGCEIIVVRDGTALNIYADKELVLTVDNVIDYTGDWFGIGIGIQQDRDTDLSDISFITGAEKVEAYLETTGVIKAPAGVDGSVVKYTGANAEYTVPTATATNMLGAALPAQVTTVVKNAKGAELQLTDGKITIPEYEGVQYITVTYSATGCKDVTVKINFQKEGSDVLMAANDFGAYTIDANGNTVSYDKTKAYDGDTGSIKVTLASSETAIIFSKADLDGYRYLEFYISTDTDNVQTGAWWNQDTAVPNGSWKKVIIDLRYSDIDLGGGAFPLRLGGTWNGSTNSANNVVNANVYISSVKLLKATEKSSDTQLNNITTAVTYDGGAKLTVVEKSAVATAINDDNVNESKLLKVEANGNELALRVCEVYTSSLDFYDEVYFWVYIDDPNNNGTTVQGGTHWCANKNLEKGWTKITVTRNTNWTWVDGTGEVYTGVPTGVGGKNPYTEGADKFVYRLMNGTGKTMYVTSLYGVPKTTT